MSGARLLIASVTGAEGSGGGPPGGGGGSSGGEGGGGGGGVVNTLLVSANDGAWAFTGSGFVATVSCSATGGLEPYTYLWTFLSGDPGGQFINPEEQTSALVSGYGDPSTANVLVTDANGLTATSNTINIT